MYLIREETASSLPAIGQAFGGRDHTTVLHSYEKISHDCRPTCARSGSSSTPRTSGPSRSEGEQAEGASARRSRPAVPRTGWRHEERSPSCVTTWRRAPGRRHQRRRRPPVGGAGCSPAGRDGPLGSALPQCHVHKGAEEVWIRGLLRVAPPTAPRAAVSPQVIRSIMRPPRTHARGLATERTPSTTTTICLKDLGLVKRHGG
jgi:hypothetical protein